MLETDMTAGTRSGASALGNGRSAALRVTIEVAQQLRPDRG
jgi:hypothetical protein